MYEMYSLNVKFDLYSVQQKCEILYVSFNIVSC